MGVGWKCLAKSLGGSGRLAGDTADLVKVLSRHGFTSKLGKEAGEVARQRGAFTVLVVVDALARLAGRLENAGDRSEADTRGSALLALVS